MAHNISSPYWPLGHRLHATCGWYITAPENYTVVLHLKYKLSMDSVKVYDAESSVISLLAHFTGRVPGHLYQATIYSNFRRLYILFERLTQMKDFMHRTLPSLQVCIRGNLRFKGHSMSVGLYKGGVGARFFLGAPARPYTLYIIPKCKTPT